MNSPQDFCMKNQHHAEFRQSRPKIHHAFTSNMYHNYILTGYTRCAILPQGILGVPQEPVAGTCAEGADRQNNSRPVPMGTRDPCILLLSELSFFFSSCIQIQDNIRLITDQYFVDICDYISDPICNVNCLL
jgi:hypothetical protein